MRFRSTPKQVRPHLSDSELDEELLECQLCRNGLRSYVLPIQTNPSVSLLRCEKCLTVSVSRFPKASVLDSYYQHDFPNDKAHKSFGAPSKAIAKNILKSRVHNFSGSSNLRVLDFGGGDGSIGLAIFSLLGASGSLTIVDYDRRQFANSPHGINVKYVQDLGKVSEAEFDVVIASAVLEHLPHPKECLLELADRLAIGGIMYVRTPFVVPLLKLINRFGVKPHFAFPGHLHDLGQPFWENRSEWLPDSSGIETLTSKPSPASANFGSHPVRFIFATLVKLPWYVLGRHYPLVGAWECCFTKPGPASCTTTSL